MDFQRMFFEKHWVHFCWQIKIVYVLRCFDICINCEIIWYICWEKGPWWWEYNWCSCYSKQYGCSTKHSHKHRTIWWSSHIASGYISNGNQISVAKRCLCFHVYCSFTHNSQDTETTSLSVGRWMGKENVMSLWKYVYIHTQRNSIQPLKRKELLNVLFNAPIPPATPLSVECMTS